MARSGPKWIGALALLCAGAFVLGVAGEATCEAGGGIGCHAQDDEDTGLTQLRARTHFGPLPDDCPDPVQTVAGFKACFKSGKKAQVTGLVGQFPEFAFPECNTQDTACIVGSGAAMAPGPLAFAAGPEGLTEILTLQHTRLTRETSSNSKENGIKFTAAVTSLVGFPRSFLLGYFEVLHPVDVPFIVLKAPTTPLIPTVPTFSFFTELINDILKVKNKVLLEVSKNLTLTYAFNSNPVQAFSIVTGCDAEKVMANIYGIRKPGAQFETLLVPEITDAECSKDFTDTLDFVKGAITPQSPPDDCILKFFQQDQISVTPAALRALYFVCFDASPLFTGNGFGFSTMVNPIKEVPFAATTRAQQFTSRELVIGTVSVKDLMEKNPDDVAVLHFPTIPNVTTTAIRNKLTGDLEFNADFYDFLEQGFFPKENPNP